MPETPPPPPTVPYYLPEDEIDLYELWLILKKRKYIIFLVTILFFCVALIYIFFSSSPVYQINFSVKSQFATPFILKQQIDHLNLLIKEKRTEDLKYLPGLSENDLEALITIDAKIPRKAQNILSINVKAKDREALNLYKEAILDFLRESPYIKEQENIKKEKLKKTIIFLKQEIQNLDKLRSLAITKKALDVNPLEIEKNIIELKNRLIALEVELSTLKPLELISESPIPKKPVKPKKKLILAVAIVSGLFSGIFLAFFVEWLENARKKYEKSK